MYSIISHWKCSTYWARVAVIFFILGISYRLLRYGLRMPIWGDEAMLALNFLDRDLGSVFEPLLYSQVLPAGYLFLSWLLMQLAGYSEWVLRFPAVIFGCASIGFIYFFARQSVNLAAAVMAIATFSASYYSTRHAVEFKPYAADVFFSVSIMWVYYQQVLNKNNFVAITLISIFALLFSYPSIFVIAGCYTTLLIHNLSKKNTRAIGKLIISSAIVCFFFGLYYISYIRIQSQHGAELYSMWNNTFPPKDIIQFPGWLITQLSGRMMAYPLGGKNFGSIIFLILCIVGITRLIQNKHYCLTGILLLPLLYNLIAATLHLYPFGGSARFAQFAAPSIVILIAVAIVGTNNNAGKKTWYKNIWLGFCFILCIAGMAYSISKPYKTKDDLYVRDIIEDFRDQYSCPKIITPNTITSIPVNFRWYLHATKIPITTQSELSSIQSDKLICIIIFDSQRYPSIQKQRETFFKNTTKSSLSHHEKVSISIYGVNKNLPHEVEIIIQDTQQ